MVESQLLGDAVANAISPTITHVPHPRPFGTENESGAGGSHAAKLGILLPDGVNPGIRLTERPMERWKHPFMGMFLIKVRYILDGLGAGLFTDGVAAHSVGHDKNMPTCRIPGGIDRRACGARILVMAPLDAHIGQGGVSDRLKYRHEQLPDWAY
jgi:hypothetical protein